ncbi:hypothetical protein AMTRI_Chr11g99900 [Amborella trichopoda]
MWKKRCYDRLYLHFAKEILSGSLHYSYTHNTMNFISKKDFINK